MTKYAVTGSGGPDPDSATNVRIGINPDISVFQFSFFLPITTKETYCDGTVTTYYDTVDVNNNEQARAAFNSPTVVPVSGTYTAKSCPYGCTFTMSWNLNPVVNICDSCNEDRASSIVIQNQSLGEDVPVVGAGFSLHYESDRTADAAGDNVATADALSIAGWTLSVHHAYDVNTNTLFLGDGRQRNGSELGIIPVSDNGDYLLTSEDGSKVYVFDHSTGQHIKTVKPLTGALVYRFGYDAAGNLVTVTDGSGNVTTIKRDSSEHPTAIISPYGQTTVLSLDANGFLNRVTDPRGASVTFNNTKTGLLKSRTDAKGHLYTYSYNNGLLIKESDPAGGYTTFGRTNASSGFGWTVGETTAMSRTSGYQTTLNLPWIQDGTQQTAEHLVNTWPQWITSEQDDHVAN